MIYYFIAILILEAVFISISIEKKEMLYYKIGDGIYSGFFLSILVYCVYANTEIFSYDTGAMVTLNALYIAIILTIINVLLGILNYFCQKILKRNHFYVSVKRRAVMIPLFLVFFVSLGLTLTQYKLRENEKIKIDNEVKTSTLAYLKNKYGDVDFEIESIDRHFAANGFVGTNELENYNIKVVYPTFGYKFTTTIKVDSNRHLLTDTFYDYMMSNHIYSSYFTDKDLILGRDGEIVKINAYLKENKIKSEIVTYNNFVSELDANIVVSKNYGKIPSKEELYDLMLNYMMKNYLKVEINPEEIKSEDHQIEVKNYLINLSQIIINYYTELPEYNLYYEYNDGVDVYKGNVSIDNEFINIDGNIIKDKIAR